MTHILVVIAPYFLCFMESNALEKSMNNSVASRFLGHMMIVRICEVMDRFLRKPFWFFVRIFSISDYHPLNIFMIQFLVLFSVSFGFIHQVSTQDL